jgi:hypothetical protein
MGCGMSTEEREGKARNEEIENQLKKDRLSQRNEIKMLLLGTFDPCNTAPIAAGFATSYANAIQVLVNRANPPSSSR